MITYTYRPYTNLRPGDVIDNDPWTGDRATVVEVVETLTDVTVKFDTRADKTLSKDSQLMVRCVVEDWPDVEGLILIREGYSQVLKRDLRNQLAYSTTVDSSEFEAYQLIEYPNVILTHSGGDRITKYDLACAVSQDTARKLLRVAERLDDDELRELAFTIWEADF